MGIYCFSGASGKATGFGAAEKSYSLSVRELGEDGEYDDAVPSASSTNAVIPIFVQAKRPAPAARVDELSVNKGHVHLKVKNVGTSHFRLRTIKLVGDEGKWQQTVPAWYVLSGNERAWDYELPPGLCDHLRRLSVEFQGDEVGGSSTITIPNEACAD